VGLKNGEHNFDWAKIDVGTKKGMTKELINFSGFV